MKGYRRKERRPAPTLCYDTGKLWINKIQSEKRKMILVRFFHAGFQLFFAQTLITATRNGMANRMEEVVMKMSIIALEIALMKDKENGYVTMNRGENDYEAMRREDS